MKPTGAVLGPENEFGPENVLRRFMSEGIGHLLLFLTECLFQF